MRKRFIRALGLFALLVSATAAVADGHGGSTGTELSGTVTALPAGGLVGDWTIADRTVHVSTSTEIEEEGGAAAVGAFAEVKGASRADGSIDAAKLEVKAPPRGGVAPQETRFVGVVDGLPASGLVGDWSVGGRTVHVTSATKVEMDHGALVVGAMVQVEGTLRSDASVDARALEVEESDEGGKAPPEITEAPETEIRGAVDVLASGAGFLGDWTVAGITVHVTAATSIRTEERTLAMGSFVEVKGTKRADGSVDAARIELLWGPSNSGASLTSVAFIASSAHAAGRAGAFFTTSLTLSNASTSAVAVEIRFHGHDRDGRLAQVGRMTLAPGETRTIDDVLGALFASSSDFGSIEVASNSGALLVSSRTGTAGGGGRFGQDVPAAGREDLVREGSSRLVAGVRQDSSVRTNLVVANAGEMDTDVEVELEDAAGAPLGNERITLRPLEMRQLNDVARALGAPDGFRDGRLRLSTPTANGAFAAFASEIDNGTNDPRTLWPR